MAVPTNLVPLTAGIYDVRCYVGPDYHTSGFMDQHGNGRGRVIVPQREHLMEWARESLFMGPGGAWHPLRSACVVWDSDPNETYYYKCGDVLAGKGTILNLPLFDLSFNPEDVPMGIRDNFGRTPLDLVLKSYEGLVQESCPAPVSISVVVFGSVTES